MYDMKKNVFYVAIIVGIVVVTLICAIFFRDNQNITSNTSGVLQVVTGENFWGSIVSQIGGVHVHVLSIVSDPNADPHEYESNTESARAFADANYVILNGAGYDSWGDKLISATTNPDQKVLRVADLLGKKDGDNPHFWYNPIYVNKVAQQMETDLIVLDPKNADYYKQQYALLQNSFAEYQGRIASIKKQFGGTKVAATEDIFAYLADASGLDLISPTEFIQAVAEGNDPSVASIVTFQKQLQSGEPKVLVYNQQTVTPITENMKKLAADNGIPVIGITETIQPSDASFQEWMNAELIELQNALNADILGK
jgi:zinc/manganese transport system substrate-binding protein